ncbi:MAG: AAA domain-containing protein, partial [bacterium]|nr:AAA domain-containing protein [bacterium]
MNILLSFTGFHDPYASSVVEGQHRGGPILTVLAHRKIDFIALFSTPRTIENTDNTKKAVKKLYPGCHVQIINIPLEDPTDYQKILMYLRRSVRQIQKKHPDADFYISTASGTPQMHACWLMMAASGEIHAALLQPTPPQFVSDGHFVKEIDIHHPDFPEVRSTVTFDTSDHGPEGLNTLLEELRIIGNSPAFTKSLDRAYNLAGYDVNVFLLGETGCGKELFARLIHELSPRKDKPFIIVNCTVLPETLLESLLFGHVKGAFSGAVTSQKGKFEIADGGTLFLDEIGDMPAAAQAKLLRAIEYGEIEPLGHGTTKKVDVRIIAATNKNIRKAVKDSQFRQDLYYRFGGVVDIPPLRDRKSDIAVLAQHILDRWNTLHQSPKKLSPDAISSLRKYSWPGNVRELIKVIEDSAIMTAGRTIKPEDLRFDEPILQDYVDFIPEPYEGFDINEFCGDIRRKLIEKALEKTNGNKSAAAKLLGVSPQ